MKVMAADKRYEDQVRQAKLLHKSERDLKEKIETLQDSVSKAKAKSRNLAARLDSGSGSGAANSSEVIELETKVSELKQSRSELKKTLEIVERERDQLAAAVKAQANSQVAQKEIADMQLELKLSRQQRAVVDAKLARVQRRHNALLQKQSGAEPSADDAQGIIELQDQNDQLRGQVAKMRKTLTWWRRRWTKKMNESTTEAKRRSSAITHNPYAIVEDPDGAAKAAATPTDDSGNSEQLKFNMPAPPSISNNSLASPLDDMGSVGGPSGPSAGFGAAMGARALRQSQERQALRYPKNLLKNASGLGSGSDSNGLGTVQEDEVVGDTSSAETTPRRPSTVEELLETSLSVANKSKEKVAMRQKMQKIAKQYRKQSLLSQLFQGMSVDTSAPPSPGHASQWHNASLDLESSANDETAQEVSMLRKALKMGDSDNDSAAEAAAAATLAAVGGPLSPTSRRRSSVIGSPSLSAHHRRGSVAPQLRRRSSQLDVHAESGGPLPSPSPRSRRLSNVGDHAQNSGSSTPRRRRTSSIQSSDVAMAIGDAAMLNPLMARHIETKLSSSNPSSSGTGSPSPQPPSKPPARGAGRRRRSSVVPNLKLAAHSLESKVHLPKDSLMRPNARQLLGEEP